MPRTLSTENSDNQLEAGLQEIMDAVIDGVCGFDDAGNATFCNGALLRMTGYSTEEIIGMNVYQLLHPSRFDGTPCAPEECGFHKAFGTHQAVHAANEFLWRKNKSYFPVEYWIRPLSHPSGVTRHVATIKDITERQEAQEGLLRSEEKFR